MNSHYDVIICGTSFKEAILGGLISSNGKKVLQLDINDYYGGEAASLSLNSMIKKFNKSIEYDVAKWGNNRDWNIDLIPKFIMSNGKLVKILLKTKVKDYIQFSVVNDAFVYQPTSSWLGFKNSIHRIPSSETEILSSGLIPLTEKLRGRNFFRLIANWRAEDPATFGGFNPRSDLMKYVYNKYNLNPNIRDFVGHAVALEYNDEYLNKPFGVIIPKLTLYMRSVLKYGKSPFIYPLYGLSTLPEGFSRLCAVHGGTFVLRAEINKIVTDENEKIKGVKFNNGQLITCDKLICSPNYVHYIDKNIPMKKTQKVIRVINILNHSIKETNNSNSCQIIFSQKQLKRKNDVYLVVLGSEFGVCPEGKYLSIISSIVETENPLEELKIPLSFLEDIEQQFVYITDLYEVASATKQDNIYVTNSLDPMSHFEKATQEVIDIWEIMEGQKLDLD